MIEDLGKRVEWIQSAGTSKQFSLLLFDADNEAFTLGIYEVTADNAVEPIVRDSRLFYEPLNKRFDNLMISYNFCQNAYVFAEITDIVGEDVDLDNYSMFKPEYPVTNYGVNDTIPDGGELTIDGFLPAGTVIDLYLACADGPSVGLDHNGGWNGALP